MQESEARLNQTTALKLPRDTFKDLSNFLSSYSSVPDICRLPDLVASQTQTLVEITLNSLFQDDEEYHHVLWDPESMKCAKNISISLVGEHQARILSVMQKHLLDLSLLSQSFRLAHNVISTIRRHSFSRSCIVSLTRMRYCPLCAGYGVKPCLFKCINTLRGCFADLAEVHSDFLGLISSLRVLSQDLIKEMRPNTFEDSYFNHFVSMVQDLWAQREFLKETVSRPTSMLATLNLERLGLCQNWHKKMYIATHLYIHICLFLVHGKDRLAGLLDKLAVPQYGACIALGNCG